MFYLGQYNIEIKDGFIEFPFDIEKDQVKYCYVETKDHDEYLIIDYIEEVEQLDCYREIEKGMLKIDNDTTIIPKTLYDLLGQDVVMAGAGDVLEVWNRERFDHYCDKQRVLFEKLKNIGF